MSEPSEQTVSVISILASLICISLGTVFWIYYRQSQSATSSTSSTATTATNATNATNATTTTRTTNKDGDLIDYPPTPPERHWLWKHGVALKGDGSSSHDVIFLQWMEKLQSKVVMFDVPVLGRMIVVGDITLARHVLQSKSKKSRTASAFPKSPTYQDVVPLIGKKSIVVMEGDEWAHQRKIFNPGFSPDYLKGIVTTIAQKCDRFLEFCETEDIASGLPTDLLARAIDLTSDVIAQVAFGEDWGYNSEEDNGGVQTLITLRDLTTMIGNEMRNPINRLNPYYKWRMSRLSVSLDQDMQRLVRRRLATIQKAQNNNNNNTDNTNDTNTNNTNDNNDNPKKDPKQPPQKDILSLTLSSVLKANEDDRKSRAAKDHPKNSNNNNTLKNQSSSEEVLFGPDDMECMTSQLKTFYFAGHDTTATTIAWAFWLLLRNPETLQRARDEVKESLGKEWVDAVTERKSHEQIIPGESTTYENLQKCQYLDAISRETLRLYPPAASTRYAADPDATYGNYKLGKSIVHLNFYAIQRDPDLWGKDANEFRPERFLGDEGRKKINSFAFLPFSKGSRDCIGKYFALLETKIALAALITRYDGSVVDADREVYTARLTSVPKNGCLVQLARRGNNSIHTAA